MKKLDFYKKTSKQNPFKMLTIKKTHLLSKSKNHKMLSLKFNKKSIPKSNAYYIDGIRSNNRIVIKHIYSTFLPSIEKFVKANKGNASAASDIFQDALIIIFKKIQNNELNIQSEFGHYLFGICKNLWLKKLNKNKRANEVNEGIVFEPREENVTEIEMVEREKQKLYEEKFKLLKPSYQKILTLYFEGKSMSEIAQIMGFKSANYAQKRKYQCQEYLKELIRKDKRYQELTE